MASNPFIVEPAERKIELPPWEDRDGNTWSLWITVKGELSHGESMRMMKSVSSMTQEIANVRGAEPSKMQARLEWTDYSIARMVTYIVDWSIAHEPNFKLPATKATYEKLPSDLFKLIDEALDAHEVELQRQKKAKNTETLPSAISA